MATVWKQSLESTIVFTHSMARVLSAILTVVNVEEYGGGVRKPRIVNSTNNLMKPCLIFLIIDEESIEPRTGSQIARV